MKNYITLKSINATVKGASVEIPAGVALSVDSQDIAEKMLSKGDIVSMGKVDDFADSYLSVIEYLSKELNITLMEIISIDKASGLYWSENLQKVKADFYSDKIDRNALTSMLREHAGRLKYHILERWK